MKKILLFFNGLLFRFKNVNGDLLRELQRMRVVAADTFYATLKTDLKMNLIQVLKFSRALDKL